METLEHRSTGFLTNFLIFLCVLDILLLTNLYELLMNRNWQDQVFPRRKAQMKAEGREEVAQASEHCFRLLTRPSCSLSSTCWCNDSSGQSWAAKHPNTLLSPSDSHRRHPVFKSLRRRASLVCFHSTFSAAGYFIQLSRPLDAGCCHSKHSVEALTRSNLASSSLPYVRALHKFSLSLSIDSNEMPTQPPPIKPQQ